MRFSIILLINFILFFNPYFLEAATHQKEGFFSTRKDNIRFLTNAPGYHDSGNECSTQIESMLKEVWHKLTHGTGEQIKIDISVFSLTDEALLINPNNKFSLVEIIKAAKQLELKKPSNLSAPHIKIRVLTDTSQSKEFSFRILNTLLNAARGTSFLEIKTLGTPSDSSSFSKSLMHTKMAIISDYRGNRELIMGSYNWTASARANNYENCLYIKSSEGDELSHITNRAASQFETLWSAGTLYTSRVSSSESDDISFALPQTPSSTRSSSPEVFQSKRPKKSLPSKEKFIAPVQDRGSFHRFLSKQSLPDSPPSTPTTHEETLATPPSPLLNRSPVKPFKSPPRLKRVPTQTEGVDLWIRQLLPPSLEDPSKSKDSEYL